MKNNQTLLAFFIVLAIYFVLAPSLINYAEPTFGESVLISLMRFPLFSFGLPENSILFILLLILNVLFWVVLIKFILSFFYKIEPKMT
jgi:hypothetical protein